MFMITAKFTKKKAVIGVLALGLLAVLLILLAGNRKAAPTLSLSQNVGNNAERVAYLQSLGWAVTEEPLEVQEIRIPKEFSGVYADYAELQKSQGFSLEAYSGMTATRYSYAVTNHPSGSANVVADLLVYRNRIIAGDVQSTALDGFMGGLTYPTEK